MGWLRPGVVVVEARDSIPVVKKDRKGNEVVWMSQTLRAVWLLISCDL